MDRFLLRRGQHIMKRLAAADKRRETAKLLALSQRVCESEDVRQRGDNDWKHGGKITSKRARNRGMLCHKNLDPTLHTQSDSVWTWHENISQLIQLNIYVLTQVFEES